MNSSPIFQAAPSFASGGEFTHSVAVGDFNGDGKQDLVLANLCVSSADCTGTVTVLLGNGDGTFQPGQTYVSGGKYAASVAVGDFNGDGKQDLAVANLCGSDCSRSTVGVLIGNGDGTFQSAQTFASGAANTFSVTVGDFNGDDRQDLVLANECASSRDCSTGTVSVLLGHGDGTFRHAQTYGSGGEFASSVAVGDFNRDGKLDLAVANQCASTTDCSHGTVGVLLGNSDGTFQSAQIFGSGGTNTFSVAVGDFNADGSQDLVLASECGSGSPADCSQGTVGVLLGNGDGTFQLAQSYGSGGQLTFSVVVGDFNGDGKQDLAVANVCASTPACHNGTVKVFVGKGDGTFQASLTYASGGEDAISLAVGDFNGDGKEDLAVANSFVIAGTDTNGTVSVFLGNGDGTFQAALACGGDDAVSVAVGDFNRDGKQDLVVANEAVDGSGGVIVFLGNGDGTFQTAQTYASGGLIPLSVTVADFNGDSKEDLAVTNFGPNGSNGTVGVLLGNGDGTFQPAQTYSSGGQGAASVVVGDFNADGKQDLAVTNLCFNCSNGTVSVLLGNGDGTFQSAHSYGSGGQFAVSVAIGDFNRDGKQDVAVVNECASSSDCSHGTVSVFLGHGDGTFRHAHSYPSGGQLPFSVAVGDFNGDGRQDLAVGEKSSTSLFLGNGNGTFQTPTSYVAGGLSISVGDFNGDGKPDLALAQGNITVLLNIAHKNQLLSRGWF